MKQAGTWTNVIEYIDRIRPGFAQRIRPASPEQISRLESVIGRRLYPPYREYLEHIGDCDDDVFLASSAFSETIEHVIERSIELRDEECGPSFFEHFLRIGAATTQAYGVHVSGSEAGRVVILDGCEADTRYDHISDSLLNFTFHAGFIHELHQLSSQFALISADSHHENEILRFLNSEYRAELYCDSANWFGRNNGVLVYARLRRGSIDIGFTARALAQAIECAERAAQALRLSKPRIEDFLEP